MRSKNTPRQPWPDLVFVVLPNGEHAWLEPATYPAPNDEYRFWITPKGRQALAEADQDDETDYVPCPGCGLRNHDTRDLFWTCPDYPACRAPW